MTPVFSKNPAQRQPSGLPLFLRWLLLIALHAIPAAGAYAAPPTALKLHASLQDETRIHQVNGVDYLAWQTYWVLQWEPVPGADEYELVYKTSEGTSRKTTRQRVTHFQLEVAKGDNPKTAGRVARDLQLATIQSLLAISVIIHYRDGTVSPPSAWLQVGRVFPE